MTIDEFSKLPPNLKKETLKKIEIDEQNAPVINRDVINKIAATFFDKPKKKMGRPPIKKRKKKRILK